MSKIVLAAVQGNGLLIAKIELDNGMANVLNNSLHDVLDMVSLSHVALSRGCLSVMLFTQLKRPQGCETHLQADGSVRLLVPETLDDLVDDSGFHLGRHREAGANW